MKVGVIGLGEIGGGVALCLARAGTLNAVYDISPGAAQKLAIGLPNSASPRAVAQACDVVLIAVFDADQVNDVLAGEEGVLAAEGRAPVVLLSTVSVEDYHGLRELAARAGTELLDCGVSGGSSAATGGLVCLIGGSEEVVEQVRPALDGFAKGVFRMGDAGAGMAGKIARNVIVYGTWRAEHEAFALAKAAGVDGAQLVAAVMESRDSMSPPADWARRERVAPFVLKDLSAALELAAKVGVELPSTTVVRSLVAPS